MKDDVPRKSEKTDGRAAPPRLVGASAPSTGSGHGNGRWRANELDGRAWTRNSISVWSDIRKSPEEMKLGHPAIFPLELVTRLIQCFTASDDRVVLDPFSGVGSTALGAALLGKTGIGIELSAEFTEKARGRHLLAPRDAGSPRVGECRLYTADARNLLDYVAPGSVDLVITSPPYWDILLQRRSADGKPVRHYGAAAADLGKISDYQEFLHRLGDVFTKVCEALRPGKYCIAIVMDLRKKDRFFPLHADLAAVMGDVGFIYDDLIVWDRRQEYNNLRPLGYPYRFRINKAHEFILIFRKPDQ